MNIIIKNADRVEFNSLDDLNKIIPQKCRGKAVNYGQGEGQIEIEGSIWGIYCHGEYIYHLQYEEGLINWSDLIQLSDSIMTQISSEFGNQLTFAVQGALMHHDPKELYLSE